MGYGKRGYIAGNSVLASEIGKEKLFENVRYNPPCFEPEKNKIRSVGSIDLSLSVDGEAFIYSESKPFVKEETYPLFCADFHVSDDVGFTFTSFAPIGKESSTMFLPFIVMEFSFKCRTVHEVRISLDFICDEPEESFVCIEDSSGEFFAKKEITVKNGSKVRAAFGVLSEDSFFFNSFGSKKEIMSFAIAKYDDLYGSIRDFISLIPKYGMTV